MDAMEKVSRNVLQSFERDEASGEGDAESKMHVQ